MVIEDILGRTISMQASSAGMVDPDTTSSMLDQLNERLSRDGHAWRIRVTEGCLEFYDL
jgi:hypothetical protein